MAGLSAVLMAGGQSRRMGQNKALIALGGQTIIEHILARVRAGLAPDEILLITHQPEQYAFLGLPSYPDVLPGKGALGGIYSALTHSRGDFTFVIACDMPFIRPALLRYLEGLRATCTCDAVVPRLDGRAEGMFAFYAQTCRAPVRAALDAGELKVISFYDQVRVRYVDEGELAPYDPGRRSFFNVNTPEDLALAEQMIEEGD